MAIIGVSVSIIAFFSVKLYPLLLDMVDLHGCMIIFGVGSIIGALFVIFVVDETNGKCLDDVGADEKTKIQFARATRANSIF